MSRSANDLRIDELMTLILEQEGFEDELRARLINKYQHNPNITNQEHRNTINNDMLLIIAVYGGLEELNSYFVTYPEVDGIEDLEEALIYAHDYGTYDNLSFIAHIIRQRRSPITAIIPQEATLLTDEELEMEL